MTDTTPAFRSGFVALVGRPNAGKSTLVNACMGEKIAITSPVAQTTRRRMRAVVNTEASQLVIIDTPGLHKPKDALGSELNKAALAELADADVVAFLVDATKPVGTGDAWVASHVAKADADYKLLVVTKADIAGPQKVAEQFEAARGLATFDDELVISAKEGFNVDAFLQLVSAHLPEGPKWFPDDMDTDTTDEDLVAEFVRGSLPQPAPGAPRTGRRALRRDRVRRRRPRPSGADHPRQARGQKGIVVGAGGQMVKKVGTEARHDIEKLLGCKVFLELRVRVEPQWRRNANIIQRLGYGEQE